MPINIAAFKRNIHRLVTCRVIELRSLAVRQWVVGHGDECRIPPAIRLEDSITKVNRLCDTRNREAETLLLDGGVIKHAPTEAYLIKGVDLAGAFLYSRGAKMQPGYGREQLFTMRLPRKRRIASATLMANNSGSHYFGNFLWDDMPLAILDDDRQRHISMVKRPYDHEPGYRELLGVPAVPLVEHAHIDELKLYSDFAQNASKEARMRDLRSRIRKHLPHAQSQPLGIFIRRGRTGELRVMENEPEIEEYLASQGFSIIDPTSLSAHEIAVRSLGAKLVVGVEGSHLAHALYTIADDACFLVLQPPNRFSLVHKEFADRMGMRYSFLVGDRSEQGFSVCMDDLKRLLERVL